LIVEDAPPVVKERSDGFPVDTRYALTYNYYCAGFLTVAAVMVTESKYSLARKRERKDSARRAEIFLVCSILFHAALLTAFSLLTIDAASKPDKPIVVELKDDQDKNNYEFNDFPQKNETDKEVESNRLSDKNRKVERETVRRGTSLGGGSSRRPGVAVAPTPRPENPENDANRDRSSGEDRLVAKKETGSELAKKHDASVPQSEKKRLTVEDLIPGQDDVARLDQPFGTSAPGVTEEEDVSLNTTEFKYYSYFAHIKQRIELAWNYPHEAQERRESGRLTIVFTIESGGNVSSVKLIESSGYEILDEYAMNAVRFASPFNPIPASIGTKRLRITANFEYIMSLFGVR
jgi:protein TonB